jgi:hypothetical protein
MTYFLLLSTYGGKSVAFVICNIWVSLWVLLYLLYKRWIVSSTQRALISTACFETLCTHKMSTTLVFHRWTCYVKTYRAFNRSTKHQDFVECPITMTTQV